MRTSPQDTFNSPPPKRIRRRSPTHHHGALFATAVAPSDADSFASVPPYWTPAEDASFADVYRGTSIYGESSWLQSHGISQVDQRFGKPLPISDPFRFNIFQPTSSLAQAPPPPALSTVSSITHSSPSIVSQPSSAGSGVSPTQTDFPYEWPTTKTASTISSTQGATKRSTDLNGSTGRAQSRFICLGHQCDETFDQEKDLAYHFKTVHTYTCNWASCEQPSFSSKDGLTWHVKLEHLLICPAPGCTESSFQTNQILESHIRCAHPDAEGNNKGKAKEPLSKPKPLAQTMATPSSSHDTSSVPAPSQRENLEERAIKQILSVTVSKKKCREKLRDVVEKRYRRQRGDKGQTPLAAESPSDLSRPQISHLINNAAFAIVWEHAVLPFLSEFIPKWCGPKHILTATRNKSLGTWQIRITVGGELPSRARKIIIAAHVRDLLPESHRAGVKFLFVKGSIDRLVWARGLSKEMPDEICMAKNPYYFKDPCMGDSIGIDGDADFEESTSTLGPCLLIGGGSYWLANFHPFVEAYQRLASVSVQHPSPSDRGRCIEERHDTLPDTDFALGSLTATSGIDLKTTRITHHPYWEDCDKEPPLVATDWVLIASKTRQANILRRFPSETMPLLKETPVKTTSAVVPGATVVSTGRTSGQQRGEVCEIPDYVSAEMNGTGKATREWFIEEPCPYDDEEGWIRGGIGVEGDSGAAIVDAETNSLVGQLWGRNRYWGGGSRITYFTPIGDLFDDIQERCDQQARPQLPQYRNESECYPVYPTCRQCYDLRTYLDSRRSSRESLRSMIGRNESDHGDLTSIGGTSELATPKDHAFWTRASGVEEVGTSFTSIMSPSAAHPFCFTPQPGTPGIVDVKSPYALTLSAEDLYDDDAFTRTNESGPSKRAAAVPLMRSSSQNAKRQRLH
ncbi:hypothetical protein BDP81DRAFT_328297 [Colletotrichum phormii]|uniref:C2H2-type domain-containing protein n=1 Tax=Colletotrichum phormii TaxID=359342 RepID=A0AAI9ZIJ1_9PEZI|nr:uncharacterized protein BDP81DRAFT_328297 [Colletotrichum phormii]KAK1625234.1 hypothetical protein BDP81DRAFT_328297 [Colletotrichum phormii]